MSDVVFILILLAFFALAIGVVQVLSRMIERGTDSDTLADEPPETGSGFPGPGAGAQGEARPR